MNKHFGEHSTIVAWYGLGLFLIGAAVALRVVAPVFAYEAAFGDMPIRGFVAIYVMVAAVAAIAIPMLVRRSPTQSIWHILILIVAIGAIARLSQLGVPTVLEDDYNRYLWDGAVVALGNSPFQFAPLDVMEGHVGSSQLRALAEQGASVLERVNYPEYRTIYPPVAQAAFAVSHVVAPFDLDGWRITLFLFELASIALIYFILIRLDRSPLWLAVYWWNPLVIKEIANSAHMEPVLMLPVLIAGYLVVRGRAIWASVFLSISAGVKIWPLLMVAAVWRQFLGRRRTLALIVGVTLLILAVIFWPVVASRLDENSGFVVFAQNWKASSAVILISEWLTGIVVPGFEHGPLLARALLGVTMLIIVSLLCARAAPDNLAVFQRLFLIAATLYILSPSQTPWYFLWIAPFLCFFPVRGLMLAGVTLPLHYLFFHFAQHDQEALYRSGVVWFIWVPVWCLLLNDVLHRRKNLTRSYEAA